MKLFQISIFFIITQVSMNYDIYQMDYNIMEYKNNLQANSQYIFYLKYSSNNNYFEFELELNKKNAKSFSLGFVKDSYISSYSVPKSQTINYSELNIQENGEKIIMKWSKTFPFTSYYLGIIISPNESIDRIGIKMLSNCLTNDYITILVFAIFFGICIFLCVLTLIMTKACGSKDSNDIVINKTKPSGLVQNELGNSFQP